MAVDALEVRLGISGDQAVVSGLGRVRKAEDQAVQGTSALSNAMSAMEIPALRAIGVAQGLATAILGLGAGAIAMSGIKLAAQYERLEVGFTNLLGSAQAARQLMSELRTIGEQTPFQTLDLTGFARQLVATGSTAKGVVREIRAITDAMAAAGGTTQDVGAIASVMSRMRIAPRIDMREIEQLSHAGINVSKVYNAATGQNVQPQIAMARLANMRGQQAFDTILKGMEKLYGGAAASQAATGLGLLQNILETLGNVALPTGAILLTVIKPLAVFLLNILGLAKGLNEMTHGGLGLVVIIGLLIRGWSFLSSVVIAGYAATKQLTAALMEYTAAARGAASTTGAVATAQTAAAATSGVSAAAGTAAVAGGAKAAAGAVPAAGGAAAGAVAASVGALAKIGAFLKGAGPGLVGLALSMIGAQMQQSKNNGVKNTGDYMSGIGGGIGLGSLAALLPLPPALKLAAIAIGGIAGGLKTWWDKAHPDKAGGEDIQQKQYQVLKDIHSTLIGGGDRAQRVKSEVEAEYSLRHAVLSGIG